jgi:hypothetical protein
MADSRPNPLGAAASKVGTAWAGIAGLVSALVAFGVLTAAQGSAITVAGETAPGTVTALGTLIAGIMPVIGAVIASFRTIDAAKDHVTPVSDPRAMVTNPSTGVTELVPLVPVIGAVTPLSPSDPVMPATEPGT